jgi:hypothetical protein
MSKGKTRPDTFVTTTTGKKPLIAVTTITTVRPPSSFGSEEIAAKLLDGLELTAEERAHVATLISKPKRKVGRPRQPRQKLEEQSLHIARLFIYFEARKKPGEKIETIAEIVGKMCGCSPRSVWKDISYARQFDSGKWWASAEQKPLEVWAQLQIIP